MGCGKNGTFDIHPDWQQWAVLLIKKDSNELTSTQVLYPEFFTLYWKFFKAETITYYLQPIEGHGTWNGKECFGKLPKQTDYEGFIAVLTRAAIRTKKLKRFWSHVDAVALEMSTAKGFITSVGIGEMPWIKGATFSIWESKAAMKAFAYQMKAHSDVVVKTKKEDWYSEEMFVRFIPMRCEGSLHGINPLLEKL